jgi:hypothetical protein
MRFVLLILAVALCLLLKAALAETIDHHDGLCGPASEYAWAEPRR